MHGATVFIGFRVFESDRFEAARADRRIRVELHVGHLRKLPSTVMDQDPSLRDLEPRAFVANTFKLGICGEDHMSTAAANVTFSGLCTDHRFEIASLDAIRTSDDISPLPMLRFSWKV